MRVSPVRPDDCLILRIPYAAADVAEEDLLGLLRRTV